jgi:acyl carrier protein
MSRLDNNERENMSIENENMNRLIVLLTKILEVNPGQINKESSVDNVEAWDSLRHMNLVIAVEQEFDVSISEEDAMEMNSVELIAITLKEYGVDF